MRRTTIVFLALSLCASARVDAQTNSWANSVSSQWRITNRWTLRVAPAAAQTVIITNAGTFTVAINDMSTPASLTVSSLAVSNPLGSTTLSLINAPGTPTPMVFTVTNSATIGMGAVLNIDDVSIGGTGVVMLVSNLVADGSVILQATSTLSASGASPNYNIHLGSTANSTGSVTLLGGSLIGKIAIGENGFGSLIISNGTIRSPNVGLATAAGGYGLWQIGGGTNILTNLVLGASASATGQVVVTAGQLRADTIALGGPGNGWLITSNGLLQSSLLTVAAQTNAKGLWQIAGGTANITNLVFGSFSGATGLVSMTGGQLNTSTITFGLLANDYLAIGAGSLQANWIKIGAAAGGQALWEIDGGTSTVNNVLLGSSPGATGTVVMTGGRLDVGNITFGSGNGSSALVLSNGIINTSEMDLTTGMNGVGTLTVAGGTINLSANMYIGDLGTGIVWVTGGELDATNSGSDQGQIRLVGEGTQPYLSQLVCSGGVLRAFEVDVGHPFAAEAGMSSWTINGGTSIVSSVYVSDNVHTGQLTVAGGLLKTTLLEIGTVSGGGAVTVSGGTIQVAQTMAVGLAPHLTSQCTISGGAVNVTGFNNLVGIGGGGAGQITVSAGTLSAGTISVGTAFLASGTQPGTLTISGGTVGPVNGSLIVGPGVGGIAFTGTVTYTGGTLQTSILSVGDGGVGNMYVLSNAFFKASFIEVGNQSGAVGTLTFQKGMPFNSQPIQGLEIGINAGATGTVYVTDGLFMAEGGCAAVEVGVQGSGRFSATNATVELGALSIGPQGIFECINSQFFLFGVCTGVNNNLLRLVNSTGEFQVPINNFGTIVADNSTLKFDQLVNNSGLIVATNGSLLFSGGITNSGAVLLGPSQFCISSIVATGNDLLITWPAFGGNHYRVQATDDPTNAYSDISADIVAAGTGLGTTNYVDAGGVTNNPSRFYKVRQVY